MCTIPRKVAIVAIVLFASLGLTTADTGAPAPTAAQGGPDSPGRSIRIGTVQPRNRTIDFRLDPTQALAYLQGAGDFAAVGQEAVRGVETTHYTGTVDLRKAADNAPDEQREQLEQLLESSDLTELPAEAWIDGDGYLRKLTLDLSEATGAAGASATVAMELYGFGEDVDIDVPSDDEAMDLSDLSVKGLNQG